MNIKHLGCALWLIPLLGIQATLAQPAPVLLPALENAQAGQPAGKDPGKQPLKDKEKKVPEKKITDPPDTDVFTQTPAPIRDALGFNPHMMGDFYGTFARVNRTVFGTQTTVTTVNLRNAAGNPAGTVTQTTTVPVNQQRTFLVPIPNYGAFKVAENASPMPIDRVFFTYNLYTGIRGQQGELGPVTNVQRFVTQNRTGVVTSNVTTFFPAAPVPFVNLNREVFGFEKTFLDGRASIEMRLPLYQQPSSVDDFRAQAVGDITIIGKYAMYLNRTTGDVVSGGLAVTAPTGPAVQTFDGSIHSTFLQPWFGYIWNLDRFYVHAFHSAILPSDSRDLTMLFNDVGVGYWLYRGGESRLFRFLVPTVEAHVTTPLNNRTDTAPISVPDLVVLTGGVHIGLFRNSTLSLGAGTPVTGPRIYGTEAFVQFNRRF